MKFTYDPSVNAAYIYFKNHKRKMQVTTIRINEDIAIDLGEDEEIFGIEILDASKHLGSALKKQSVQLEKLAVS